MPASCFAAAPRFDPGSSEPVTAAASPGSVLGSLLDLLVPARCHHCDEIVRPGPWSPLLCRACGARVPAEAGHRPPILAGGAVRVRSLGPLEGPLQTVVHVAKYRGNLAAGRRLGLALGAATRRRVSAPGGTDGPDASAAADGIVPVPLHWWRRWRRGHDQARVLARGVGAAAGLSCWPALRRRRATRPQVGLGERARVRNLRAAFAARRRWRAHLPGARVLLVDDVITTGATVRAAAVALRRAGARVTGVLTAAWMPPPA